MLVNEHFISPINVKFISYTGEYPNLCMGILTLKIDGNEYKFGHDYSIWNSDKTDGNYDKFWYSDGRYGGYSEWQIDVLNIPEQFRIYAIEIDRVFNDNVPYGCCGGCR